MLTENVKANATADLSGKTCPYTVMGARDALKPLETGQVLKVIVDYQPAAEGSIPNFLKKKNYPFNVTEMDEGKWSFFIEKTN